MSTENVKILLRRGFKSEIISSTLDTGEMGFATDTNQLFIGIDDALDEVSFDPSANVQAIVQSFLDSAYCTIQGLTIDEDLFIREIRQTDPDTDELWTDANDIVISGAEKLLLDMQNPEASFELIDDARPRKNVEVITENSFNQLFVDQHLSTLDSVLGMRPSLAVKSLRLDSGTFLRYNKDICTTFFIDYSLLQTNSTSKFLRVGQLKVINGVPHGINQVKLTDDNTEMWQDDLDAIADTDEFSNIEFDTVINGDNIEINFTQDASFDTEISYTVKRWSM